MALFPNAPDDVAPMAAHIEVGRADPGHRGDAGRTRTLRRRTVAKGRLRQLNYIRDLAPQR